jgi:hypothetical protein
MSNLSELSQSISSKTSGFFKNKYVSAALIIMFTLYAGLLGPNLPNFMNNLFKYNSFKIIFFFLFLLVVQYAAKINYSVAILMSIGFVLTLDYLYLNSVRDDFTNTQKNKN